MCLFLGILWSHLFIVVPYIIKSTDFSMLLPCPFTSLNVLIYSRFSTDYMGRGVGGGVGSYTIIFSSNNVSFLVVDTKG